MKFHKLMSRTVVATALLGVTLGGAFSGISASASDSTSSPNTSVPSSDSSMQGNNTNGSASSVNSSNDIMTKSNQGSTLVTNGGLKLNSVPDLQFAKKNSSSGNQLSLKNTGLLRVTDYRSVDQNSGNGWSLKVTANGFNSDNSYDENNWQLNLNNTNPDDVKDNSGQSISSNKTKINNLNLDTNDSQHNSGYLVDNNAGQYGVTQLTYQNSGATLNVPNVKPNSNQPYTTNMNWDLSTNATSKDN